MTKPKQPPRSAPSALLAAVEQSSQRLCNACDVIHFLYSSFRRMRTSPWPKEPEKKPEEPEKEPEQELEDLIVISSDGARPSMV
jgi:hypothetical protein